MRTLGDRFRKATPDTKKEETKPVSETPQEEPAQDKSFDESVVIN